MRGFALRTRSAAYGWGRLLCRAAAFVSSSSAEWGACVVMEEAATGAAARAAAAGAVAGGNPRLISTHIHSHPLHVLFSGDYSYVVHKYFFTHLGEGHG